MTEQRSALDILTDELEDFDSEELEEFGPDRGRNKYLSSMWDRYGFGNDPEADRSRRLVLAHKMVQAFVNTFAPGRYRVTFDPNVTTAGTDFDRAAIVVSPGPIFDERITPEEAGLILTGMATHESSHPRYGRGTAEAVRAVFGGKRAPTILSNILDDVRIERRFAMEYPGYADVFRPAMAYVSRDYRSEGVKPTFTDMVNLAALAIRYPSSVDWPTPDLQAERDWWQAWAERWAREDAPRRHVMAVREGLKRIAWVKARIRKARQRKKEKGISAPVDEYVAGVQAVLAELNPTQQRIVRMRSEGRRPREIAATLGLDLDVVSEQLRVIRTVTAAKARGGSVARDKSTGKIHASLSPLAQKALDALDTGVWEADR